MSPPGPFGRSMPPALMLTRLDAHAVAELIEWADDRGLLAERFRPKTHRRLLEIRADARRTVALCTAVDELAVANGSSEALAAEMPPGSDVMTIDEAAGVLDVTPRRVRHLAPLLGVKRGGRWELDRAAVLEEAEQRANGDAL